MKKFLPLLLLLSCTTQEKKQSTIDTSTNALDTSSTSISSVPPVQANWQYLQEADKMTNKETYYAYCNSINQLNFDFPYNGGSTLQIFLRNVDNKNEVILQITKGQFMSSYNSSVSMKFDEGNVIKYNFTEAADGSSTYIFPYPSKTIIDKLKKSAKLKIEAPFYQAGRQVAEFNVSGLEWKH